MWFLEQWSGHYSPNSKWETNHLSEKWVCLIVVSNSSILSSFVSLWTHKLAFMRFKSIHFIVLQLCYVFSLLFFLSCICNKSVINTCTEIKVQDKYILSFNLSFFCFPTYLCLLCLLICHLSSLRFTTNSRTSV